MPTIVNHFAAYLYRLAFAIQFRPSIHVTYRTTVQPGIGHMHIGIELQTAQDTVQRSPTGYTALGSECELRHRREMHDRTKIDILHPDMDRVLQMSGSHSVGEDELIIVTKPQVLNLQHRVGHSICDACGIDIPQCVGYIQLRRHDVSRDQLFAGILVKGRKQAYLPTVHLLGIVAQVDGQQHGVVHSHHVEQQVSIAYAQRVRQIDMCRCAQVDSVIAVIGRENDIVDMLLAQCQFGDDAADKHVLRRFVDHSLEGQTAALGDIRRQHIEHLIQIMCIEVERGLGGSRTSQQALANLCVKHVRDILHYHLLHARAKLGVAEVSGYSSDRIIGFELQVMLRRVIGFGLRDDLELTHVQRVTAIGKQQTVDHQITVDMIDLRAEEVDVQLHLYITVR